MNLFAWFVDLVSGFGMNKVNTLCDWVAYQEKEPKSLKKYQKYLFFKFILLNCIR